MTSFRPDVPERDKPYYILEDRPSKGKSEWPVITEKRKYQRRFIVPCKRARPLAPYANHAFSADRIEEMRTRAAELGLDLTARANAELEFDDSTLLDDHFGQSPSLAMLRDTAAQEGIFVDYGEEWQHLMVTK